MPMDSLNVTLFLRLGAGHQTGPVLSILEAIASWPVLAAPLLIGALWLVGRRSDRAATVSATSVAIVALAIAGATSVLIDHPRPFAAGLAPNLLDHAADSSFPSDHATLFFALATAFALRPAPSLPWLGIALAGFGLAVGFARVALGVHFPLDILGAAAIAGVAAIVVVRGLRLVVAGLTNLGEWCRGCVPLLSTRDGRDVDEPMDRDAHPAG